MIATDSHLFLPVPELSVRAGGELLLAGHSATELAAHFGTPLVVLLEDAIRRHCREYHQRIEVYPRTRVYYAGKALLTTAICRIMQQERMGIDVVSAGELATALAAGFPAAEILLHGNAKGEDELRLALQAGVGRIVIDNLEEIERLARLAQEMSACPQVLVRVTPGVKPATHAYVQTGQVDSKFGFNLEGGAAQEAVARVLAQPALQLVGLHCHIGSQIFDLGAFALAARRMLEFYREVREQGAPLSELNIGGGLGVAYGPEDAAPSVGEHTRQLSETVLALCTELGLEPPVLCDEPGRSIIAAAGVTLYTVQSSKHIPGVRNYVSVDGGMTDNPRFALYGARHHPLLAQRVHEPPDGLWSISGKCCESGDMLLKDAPLPQPRAGELLALLNTGAYTYSMASNYNRVPRPAVVLAGAGRVGLICRRETPQDVLRLDEMPQWLG
jgi:diaminopimelate decarboxylase